VHPTIVEIADRNDIGNRCLFALGGSPIVATIVPQSERN
jgi:hypothetical protein